MHLSPAIYRCMQWRSWMPATRAGGSGGGANDGGGDGEDKKKSGEVAEAVISVPVHCDGCARKLRRSVQRLDGVEEVTVDCRTNTVIVRGPKAAVDPAGIVEVVDRRTGKKALLLSSLPSANLKPPLSPEKRSSETAKKDAAEQDMGKEMIDLHCEACCEEIKRRILKIKGVEEVTPHMKSSQVMVRGKVEPATLVGLIHKWTGRRAAIFRAEPQHPLPPPSESPPKVDDDNEPPKVAGSTEPAEEEETKQGGDPSPSDDAQEKKEGEEADQMKDQKEEPEEKEKKEEPDEKNEGGEADDLKPLTEDDASYNGVAEESHSTKDHLFRVALPRSVVAVAPPESEKMAMNSLCYSYYYYPAYPYPCHQYYQYPQQNIYAAGNYPAMYAYYPHHVPEDFSDANPNVCTVM
uniref:HMA domain-containing protein n=1 Tax=Oryza barthii TaxID=65489 RepID=A0A0D3GPU3_9ORYZ